jgi:hypothetical protein
VNPAREEDALLDYKGEPRMTPSGALTEIERLRQSDQLDDAQYRLLDELEAYIKAKFPKRASARQLTLDGQ